MKYIIGADQENDLVNKLINYLEIYNIIAEKIIDNNWAKIALLIANKVADQEYNSAILLCSSGTGMSIAANKVKGCRAALCTSPLMARYAKIYNHANVLVLPLQELNEINMIEILENWLKTSYGNGEVGIAIDELQKFEKR